jgi:hypothetical protein
MGHLKTAERGRKSRRPSKDPRDCKDVKDNKDRTYSVGILFFMSLRSL